MASLIKCAATGQVGVEVINANTDKRLTIARGAITSIHESDGMTLVMAPPLMIPTHHDYEELRQLLWPLEANNEYY